MKRTQCEPFSISCLTASLSTRFTVGTALLFLVATPVFSGEPAPGPSTERQQRSTTWEIHFEDGITVDEYSKQLDYFGIELGVVDKDGKIQYASKLSAKKPEKRISKKSLDKRLTISWRRGTLQGVDRKLLAKLGINSQGKDLLHFYSRDTEEQLYKLELEHAGPDRGEATRTRFQVRAKKEDINGKGGYEFYVVEQDFGDKGSEAQATKTSKRSVTKSSTKNGDPSPSDDDLLTPQNETEPTPDP